MWHVLVCFDLCDLGLLRRSAPFLLGVWLCRFVLLWFDVCCLVRLVWCVPLGVVVFGYVMCVVVMCSVVVVFVIV